MPAGCPVNGKVFLVCAQKFLVPMLNPGDVVVMDNLWSHTPSAVRDAIRAAGAHRLLLPACSPDLNPIEQLFAKLKALLRKARARTFDAIADSIATVLEAFAAAECANYLTNSGYASV